MHVNSNDSSAISDNLAATPASSSKIIKKRKILRPTLGAEAPSSNLKEIDDAEEISSRNLYRIMEQATKFNSPHVSPERRKSVLTNAGMSNAQIVEHITNCLKLSAENKINSKNAFNLHLIDVMGSVLNKASEQTNFQAAGSTLDASAKIYAYRVDCVHQETYKIAGGLGRSDKNSKKQDDGEGQTLDCEIQMARDQLSPVPAKKRKKKVIKGSCIETNEKVLNMAGNEVKFESDELFEKVRSSFDEGSAMGLFSNTLHTISDNNRLILHSLCDFPAVQTLSSSPVDVTDLLNSISLEDTQTHSCCPPLESFQFCNWNREEDEKNDTHRPEYAARLDLSKDADIHSLIDTAVQFDLNGLEEEHVEIDDDDRASLADSTESYIPKFPSLDAVADALSTKDLEYSYFDPNVLSTWAGPNHWKAKFGKKPTSSIDGDSEENDEPNKRKKRQTTSKRKPGDAERVDMDDENLPLSQIFKVLKASTTLTKSSWEKYYEQDRTIEPDMDVKPDTFSRLFLKPEFKIVSSKDSPDHTRDDNIGDYDLDNPIDKQDYCPDSQGDERYDDGASFGDYPHETAEPGTSSSNDDGVADGGEVAMNEATLDNDALLQQPYKVNKIEINYAKQAKRIDVRRVKECIWRILTEEDPKKGKLSPEIPTRLTSETQFSKLCQELPTIVPPQAADSLSIHSILTILLHMCNEKNLALENDKDFGDLKIFQG